MSSVSFIKGRITTFSHYGKQFKTQVDQIHEESNALNIFFPKKFINLNFKPKVCSKNELYNDLNNFRIEKLKANTKSAAKKKKIYSKLTRIKGWKPENNHTIEASVETVKKRYLIH